MPGEFDKAIEALKGINFTEEMIQKILAGAKAVEEEGKTAGVRQKALTLEEAGSAITSLETQLKSLSEQLRAVELVKTARDAVQAATEEDHAAQQQVYTLEDITETVKKAVADAFEPFQKEAEETARTQAGIWTRLQELDTVTKSAAKTVNELAGELPRQVRVKAPTRYENGREEQPVAIKTNPADEDPFGWVSEYMER